MRPDAFSRLNKHVMLPLLRSPAGPWWGNPLAGYFVVLTTTGRRTGQPRSTPLNYALRDGNVYLLAGFGERTDWLANLRANPHVELRLPGRTLHGVAERVADPAEALDAAVAVTRNAGFALLFEGLNPLTATDAQLRERLADRPVVRVRREPAKQGEGAPVRPIRPGPHDPGGWLWTLPHLVAPATLIAAAAWVRRRRR